MYFLKKCKTLYDTFHYKKQPVPINYLMFFVASIWIFYNIMTYSAWLRFSL